MSVNGIVQNKKIDNCREEQYIMSGKKCWAPFISCKISVNKNVRFRGISLAETPLKFVTIYKKQVYNHKQNTLS